VAEYKTFLFLGLVIATLAAVSGAGELVNFSWSPGNAGLAQEVFNPTIIPLVGVMGELPIIGNAIEATIFTILSIFAFKTSSAIISQIMSNGFAFMSVYMIYLFLKDRGIA